MISQLFCNCLTSISYLYLQVYMKMINASQLSTHPAIDQLIPAANTCGQEKPAAAAVVMIANRSSALCGSLTSDGRSEQSEEEEEQDEHHWQSFRHLPMQGGDHTKNTVNPLKFSFLFPRFRCVTSWSCWTITESSTFITLQSHKRLPAFWLAISNQLPAFSAMRCRQGLRRKGNIRRYSTGRRAGIQQSILSV